MNVSLDLRAPCHAEVVPSFIVPWIKRPLSCWVGDVKPRELLRWERPGDLTGSAREELRTQIVTRLRVRAEALWREQVRVNLVPEWGSRLLPSERKLFEQGVLPLLCDSNPLQQLSLRTVKDALHQPLDRVLSMLARIEAVYWVPPALPAIEFEQRLFEGVPVAVDDSLRAKAAEVLERPWVQQVDTQDLRFEVPAAGRVCDWIAQQLVLPLAHGRLRSVLQALDEAHHMSGADEARALGAAAAARTQPRQGADAGTRWVDMLMARHISPDGKGRTLQEVGVTFGVTRERVRQVCEAMEEVLLQVPVATPGLDRVLRAAARIAPSGLDEVNEQLARFIGEGAGVEALVAWAAVLGREVIPIRVGLARVRLRRQLVTVKMVETADSASWMVAALRYASRDCSSIGCSNLIRVAGMLALRDGLALGQEALEAALREASGFRWLDEDSGWFTLGDTSDSSAAKRVRKIMAVAHDTVGADAIAAALASDDMWIYREETRTLAIPPVHVLRELLSGWDFLRVVQKGRFVASTPIELSQTLSDAEVEAVSVIEANAGVACRFELKDAIIGALGVTDMAVSSMLGASPIILKLEHGLYALLGRRVGGAALDAARNRSRERTQGSNTQVTGLGPNDYALNVTEAALRNEQYSVPARFRQRLLGQQSLPVSGANGELLGTVRVNQSGAMAGLNRLLPWLKAGCVVVVTVLDGGIRVKVLMDVGSGDAEDTRRTTTADADYDASRRE